MTDAKLMPMNVSRSRIFNYILLGTMALAAISGLLILFVPGWRNAVRAGFVPQHREILSTLEGDLLSDGSRVKVVKYKTLKGIGVEILGPATDGSRPLIDRLEINDRHDGFFDFHGQASRLAILDVDGDNKVELIAPTFDEDLVAHLNIFKYNPEVGRFEPLRP